MERARANRGMSREFRVLLIRHSLLTSPEFSRLLAVVLHKPQLDEDTPELKLDGRDVNPKFLRAMMQPDRDKNNCRDYQKKRLKNLKTLLELYQTAPKNNEERLKSHNPDWKRHAHRSHAEAQLYLVGDVYIAMHCPGGRVNEPDDNPASPFK
eukprot:COSAG05_NODE_2648_length_2806_cov_2.556335_5_plen_153_part_00